MGQVTEKAEKPQPRLFSKLLSEMTSLQSKPTTSNSFSVSIKENSSVWLTKTASVFHVSSTKQPSPPKHVHHTVVSTASNLTVKCNKMLLSQSVITIFSVKSVPVLLVT